MPLGWRGRSAGSAMLVGLALAASAARSEPPLLAELKWIDPEADAVAVLTSQPAECFAEPDAGDQARRARLGRIAFRSPFLLGGVAARVGMSCDSCHRNGHDNPDFFLAGVSGSPGTADVTGAVFSSRRDDGERNPVPIPTLVDASGTPPFGSVLPARDLRSFLHAAVVDEFAGEPPLEPIVEGLMAYLKALRTAACPKPLREERSFEANADGLLQTFDLLIETWRDPDSRVARFVLLALRGEFERVYRRFPPNVPVRERLIDHSRSLASLESKLDRSSRDSSTNPLTVLRAGLEETLGLLAREAPRSYYNPNVLRQALASTP